MKERIRIFVTTAIAATIGYSGIATADFGSLAWTTITTCNSGSIKGTCKGTKDSTDPQDRLDRSCRLELNASPFDVVLDRKTVVAEVVDPEEDVVHLLKPQFGTVLSNRKYCTVAEDNTGFVSRFFHSSGDPFLINHLGRSTGCKTSPPPPGGSEQ